MILFRKYSFIAFVVVLLSACGGGGGSGSGGGNSSATLQSIAITPTIPTFGTGAIQGFTATGTYSDNTTQDITTSSIWSSSTPGVATVGSNTGVLTTISAGTTTITASLNGKVATDNITVTNAVTKYVSSISVTPSYLNITPNSSIQLTATVTYTDATTADVTSNATWSSDSTSASVNSTGLLTSGPAVGSAGITASIGAANAYAQLYITSSPPTALTVAPQTVNASIGLPYDPTPWVTSNIGAISLNSVGLNIYGCTPANAATFLPSIISKGIGGVVANAAGTCSMTASVVTNAGTVTSLPVTLTIISGILNSITIIPAAPTVGTGGTLQLAAMGTYSDGTVKDVTNLVGWSSLNTVVATVNTTGLVTGGSSGSSQIQASTFVSNGLNLLHLISSSTVTVPVSPPVQSTITISGTSAVTDNTIFTSSMTGYSNVETKVYPVGAWDNNSIGVGCIWWLDVLGYGEVQTLTCTQGLIKFNLSAIPAGKTIINAFLQLQTNFPDIGTLRRNWHVYALWTGSTWDGNIVTWNSTLGFQYWTAVNNLLPPASANFPYSIDVTNTVRNWYSGAWVNNGFEMGQDNMNIFPGITGYDSFEFYSSEDPNGRGPKLVITYQ